MAHINKLYSTFIERIAMHNSPAFLNKLAGTQNLVLLGLYQTSIGNNRYPEVHLKLESSQFRPHNTYKERASVFLAQLRDVICSTDERGAWFFSGPRTAQHQFV